MERYGVFKKFPNGSRLWVGPADGLAEAKRKMLDSALKTGFEHFVYDFELETAVATSLEDKSAAGDATE